MNHSNLLPPFAMALIPGQPPNKINFFICLLLLWVHTGSAGVLKEREIADSIIRDVDSAEVLWLGDGRNKFLSLYRETFANRVQGAVILIHDLGSNPNSRNVMKPFRDYLSEHGWMTLSLQMPVLDPGAQLIEYYDQIPEATKRVLAGVKFLRNQNIRNVVIMGYGFGAVFALNFLANQNNPIVTALVIINLPVPKQDTPKIQLEGILKKVEMPFFDIDLNRGNARRPEALKKRKRLMRNNKNYRQLETIEANIQFRDSGLILVKRVYSWIMRATPGVEIR